MSMSALGSSGGPPEGMVSQEADQPPRLFPFQLKESLRAR
jgi:hypothetical protein